MNARQRKFAHEYVRNGFIGVQAVLAAGYRMGYDSACVEASRLIRKPKVKKMIEDTLNNAELTAERTSKEIAKIAFTEGVPVDSQAKMKALDLATKVLGMQSSKLETVDLTAQAASESALLKSIQHAANRDGVNELDAARELYAVLADDPAFADPSSWPVQYRDAIRASLAASSDPIIDIPDQ